MATGWTRTRQSLWQVGHDGLSSVRLRELPTVVFGHLSSETHHACMSA